MVHIDILFIHVSIFSSDTINLQEHECRLTRDIVQLIDREMDLMSKRVRGSKLEGLRTRICTLFLQYIKTPEFNPEVSKLLKVRC